MAGIDLTKEEILNNYQWKLSEKIIKKKFPWVVKLTLNEKDLEKYSLIFVTAIINPVKFAETYNVKLKSIVNAVVSKDVELEFSYLLSMTTISKDMEKEIESEFDKIFSSVAQSAVLPNELKLPKDFRKMRIILYKIDENIDLIDKKYFI
jgi:hypothetical protein